MAHVLGPSASGVMLPLVIQHSVNVIVAAVFAFLSIWADRKFYTWMRVLILGFPYIVDLFRGQWGLHAKDLLLLHVSLDYYDEKWPSLQWYVVAVGLWQGALPFLQTLLFSLATSDAKHACQNLLYIQPDCMIVAVAIILGYNYLYLQRPSGLFWKRLQVVAAAAVALVAAAIASAATRNALSQAVVHSIRLPNQARTFALQQLQLYDQSKFDYGTASPDLLQLPNHVFDRPQNGSVIRVVELERRRLGQPPRVLLRSYGVMSNSSTMINAYTAVSYYDTGEDKDHIVSVASSDGTIARMNVTKTVFDVLYREQSLNGRKRLWLEALCVNQTDNNERTQYAARARDIFQTAEHVRIYFNASIEASSVHEWFNLLDRVGWEKRTASANTTFFDMNLWSELQSFYDTPWFSRAWSLQEALVGRRTDIVHRTASVAWKPFGHVSLNALAHKPFMEKFGPAEAVNEASVRIGRRIILAGAIAGLHTAWRSMNGFPLKSLLSYSILLNATDPRDKVFACLGLLPPETRHGVPIDYEVSTAEIMTRAMRHVLFSSQSLDSLSSSGRRHLVNSTILPPSWVARWQTDTAPSVDGRDSVFSAASTESWYGTDRGDIFTLEVPCSKVDSVKALASRPSKEEANLTGESNNGTEGAALGAKLTVWKLARDETRAKFTNETAFLEALGRALFSELMPMEQRRIDGNDTDSIVALMQRLTDDDAVIPAVRAGTEEWKQALGIERELSSAYRHGLFGITAAQRMGVFPQQVEIGDEIVLIASANRPFVVRRVQSSDQEMLRYELVGPCYVQGIMDGEALGGTWEQIALV